MTNKTKNDIDKKLETYYNSKIAYESCNVTNITKLSSGWETEVYSFDIEYKSQSATKMDNLILRTFPGENSLEKVRWEFEIITGLREQGFSVPNINELEIKNSPLGYPFIIMERIIGKTMKSAMKHASNGDYAKLRSLFCKKFTEFHNLDWRKIVPNPSDFEITDKFEWIDSLLSRGKIWLVENKLDEFMQVHDWLEKRVETVPCEKLSLVHTDYHPSNIVLSEDNEAFVIDWTGARVSDYRNDLAWTLLLRGTSGLPNERNMILKEYQRFAGTKVEHIEYFEVIATLRRLGVMAISLFQEEDIVGSRPEIDQILRGETTHLKGVLEVLKDRTGIIIPNLENLV
ncbi:MAG: phosphotransferase family protein [Candidatus Kariarchaeaceae archaeon]|jgi:aminoglycoside phosphotransferase (APT) family kinase protein